MTADQKQILRFRGFVNTPSLWHNNAIYGLSQLDLDFPDIKNQNVPSWDKKLRLGHWVEQFIFAQLNATKEVKILIKNYQLSEDKITLGELDCLFALAEQVIHLEVVYKFYLYDPKSNQTELSPWIGPNRRDSLLKKLDKLKHQQLPLLQHPKMIETLKQMGIAVNKVHQKVLFKAQLFKPYQQEINLGKLNLECVTGFYISHSQLMLFKDCKFFITNKLDWLTEPYYDLEWLTFDQFKERVSVLISAQSAPLCWLKKPTGVLEKFFVVWW